jgi:hypothetical protein
MFKNQRLVLFTLVLLSCARTEHRRMGKVPPDAIWIGGKDGGIWYKVNKALPDNQFDISVYNDQNGELEISSIFKLDTTCLDVKLDSVDLLKHIDAFDGEAINLDINSHSKLCMMIPEQSNIKN